MAKLEPQHLTGADLLEHIHPPTQGGPGAFGCSLIVEGSYVIEADAPMGTFPIRVQTHGPAQIWFVELAAFNAASADGDLTMAELLALAPLRGTTTDFIEMLAPRMEDHHVVITSRGTLQDGRTFQFNVNHPGDRTQSIMIRIQLLPAGTARRLGVPVRHGRDCEAALHTRSCRIPLRG